MKIIQATSLTNTTASKARKIDWIVIHYTAGTSSSQGAARSTASWFSKASTKASADFIVDSREVVQYNPDPANRYAWHCGGSRQPTKGGSLYGVCTNKNSIGVEVCSSGTSSSASPNDPSWKLDDSAVTLAWLLVKELMVQYNIHPSRVVRHYDVTGKLCPGVFGWNLESGSEDCWRRFHDTL